MVEYLQHLVNLVILIALEIILGIDNIIFLAILTEDLNPQYRKNVRIWGLSGALILRLILLSFALIVVKLSFPVIKTAWISFSCHDLFFILGGGFLGFKSLKEIGNELDFYDQTSIKDGLATKPKQTRARFISVVFQIMLMDLIFSLDSILTAVGLSNSFLVMAFAIVCAILVMLYASDPVSRFIHKHPSIKMLALAFLVMLGFILILDGVHYPINRNYLYFAMFFSFTVECLNLLYKHRKKLGG